MCKTAIKTGVGGVGEGMYNLLSAVYWYGRRMEYVVKQLFEIIF